MPPKKLSNKTPSELEGISDSNDNDDLTANSDVHRLLERMLDSSKVRHNKKRSGFEKEAEALTAKAFKQLADLEAEYKRKIMNLRRGQIERLRSLVKEKQELEDELRIRLRNLQSTYDDVSTDVSNVLHLKVDLLYKSFGEEEVGIQKDGFQESG